MTDDVTWDKAFTAGWSHGLSKAPTPPGSPPARSFFSQCFDMISAPDKAQRAQESPARSKVLAGFNDSYLFWHGIGDGCGQTAQHASNNPVHAGLWLLTAYTLNKFSPRMLTLGFLGGITAGILDDMKSVDWDRVTPADAGTAKTLCEKAKAWSASYGDHGKALNEVLTGVRGRLNSEPRNIAILLGAAFVMKLFVGSNVQNIIPQGLPDLGAMTLSFGCGLMMGNYIIEPIEN